MSHIYREHIEIPIPEGGYINHNDGRVFVYLNDGETRRQRSRRVIGKAASETMFYPNETFRFLYPDLWEQHFGSKDKKQFVLHAGAYAATLGIGWKSDLYPLLVTVYGPVYANAMMDFAMYSVIDKSDAATNFEERMFDQVLFSDKQ